MSPRKIYLIGHSSPNGMSWLDNCLLECGIKVDTVNNERTRWTEENGYLIPSASLGKESEAWLPILSKCSKFKFRPDVEVECGHYWNSEKFTASPVILFTRHPLDSLYSLYKRINPELSFCAFVNLLVPSTLLNRVDDWYLFHKTWLSHDKLKIVRFEDYKQDPAGTLAGVLSFMGLCYSDDLIASACEESTFDKAREAEISYKQAANITSNWPPVINRSGKIGGWKDLTSEEDLGAVKYVEAKTHDVLTRFGYQLTELGDRAATDYSQHTKSHKFLDNVLFSEKVSYDSQVTSPDDPVKTVIKFTNDLDADLIIKAKYFDWEVNELLSNLVDYLGEFNNNNGLTFEINKLLKLFKVVIAAQNHKLQTICDERLDVINTLSKAAQERLELIHVLDAEVQRLKLATK